MRSRVLQWIRLSPVMLSAVLSFALIALWSYTSWIDNVRLSIFSPAHLSVNIQQGRMQFERSYAFKESIAAAQFTSNIPPQRVVPRPSTFLGFWYSSGHEKGYSSTHQPDVVVLADYWILSIPIWAVLIPLSIPWILWLYAWYRRTRRVHTGFEIVPAHQ